MTRKFDYLKKEIRIGDCVMYTSSQYKGFWNSTVTGFTPKMVRLANGNLEYAHELLVILEEDLDR